MPYDGYDRLQALVVDDFDAFRTTVTRMLLDLGVQKVDIALNGEDALAKCKHQYYDLVLCDYNLGNGKNGQQVLEKLRFDQVLSRQTLFLLVSAESSKSIVMAAYDSEPDAYLTKPITAKTLHQRLDRLLHQRDAMLEVYRAIEAGQTDLAVDLCREKIDIGNRYASICQKLLGQLYLDNNAFDRAEDLYREVLEARQLEWAQVGMARVKFGQGDEEIAIQWLKDILLSNPLCMPAYDALVACYAARDEQEELQAVLQQAVNISPIAILRQQRLAQVAAENSDYSTAAEAYRRTVKLGEHSCHDEIGNHLSFGRCTAALFKEDVCLAKTLATEAISVLENIRGRFDQNVEEGLQAKFIESQLCVGQGNEHRAQQLLQEAVAKVEQLGAVSDLETDLDCVQALIAMGEQRKADQLLESLVQRYQHDQPALNRIDRLLQEPVSEVNRRRVAEINHQGIGFYDQGLYREAIASFKQARRLFPNHIGVQLNLVQALVGETKEHGRDESIMALCLGSMKRVEININPTHVQYQRYRKLQTIVQEMMQEKQQ